MQLHGRIFSYKIIKSILFFNVLPLPCLGDHTQLISLAILDREMDFRCGLVPSNVSSLH